MTNWLYSQNCTYQSYLHTLSKVALADLYAAAKGYCVNPGQPMPRRYEAYQNGRVYNLASLPSRDEMIEELCG